ncbi:MAG: hypothetical protein HOG25_22205 [Gammaproteobacteria bacterium]|nr:hypothetical protein [Gammaproteobacteria bacterium]
MAKSLVGPNQPLTLVASLKGEAVKPCKTCGEEKSLDDFYGAKHNKGGKMNICKTCDNKRRYRNKEDDSKDRNYYYQRKYGITLEDYDRMYKEQGGRCWICQVHQIEFETRLCVDHDHAKEGKESVRGLLCRECNRGLGTFLDDPERLQQAIRYLEKHN